VFGRKSFATTAAGFLAVVALIAGCASAPLTDVRKILSNAKTNFDTLSSVHFQLQAGGQYEFGYPVITPAPTDSPTPVPTATPSASAAPSASVAPSSSAAAPSGSAKPSGSAVPSASASATPTATPTPSPTPVPTASPTDVPSPTAAVSPTPTPTPLLTTKPIDLTGTTAEGDIDLANKSAHVTGGMLGQGGFSGELIVISPYAYYRQYGETKFSLADDTAFGVLNPALSSAPSPAWLIDQIVTIANSTSLSPVLVGTEQEASGACYHVRVEVTKDVVQGVLNNANQTLGGGMLNLWITQDSFQVERVEFTSADPSSGVAAYRVVLSNWNNVPAILTPDAANLVTAAPVPS
jgi:hypothetical protein